MKACNDVSPALTICIPVLTSATIALATAFNADNSITLLVSSGLSFALLLLAVVLWKRGSYDINKHYFLARCPIESKMRWGCVCVCVGALGRCPRGGS